MKCRQCGKITVQTSSGLCSECEYNRAHPDALSKRKTLFGRPFADMKQMDEEQRFAFMARELKAHPGKKMALFVDAGGDHEGKGDRYIAALAALLPGTFCVGRHYLYDGKDVIGEQLTLKYQPPA